MTKNISLGQAIRNISKPYKNYKKFFMPIVYADDKLRLKYYEKWSENK